MQRDGRDDIVLVEWAPCCWPPTCSVHGADSGSACLTELGATEPTLCSSPLPTSCSTPGRAENCLLQRAECSSKTTQGVNSSKLRNCLSLTPDPHKGAVNPHQAHSCIWKQPEKFPPLWKFRCFWCNKSRCSGLVQQGFVVLICIWVCSPLVINQCISLSQPNPVEINPFPLQLYPSAVWQLFPTQMELTPREGHRLHTHSPPGAQLGTPGTEQNFSASPAPVWRQRFVMADVNTPCSCQSPH